MYGAYSFYFAYNHSVNHEGFSQEVEIIQFF